MKYTAVHFSFHFAEDFASDIFVAYLAEIGFESFENIFEGIMAYIPSSQFSENKLKDMMDDFPYIGAKLVEVINIEDKNWNEEWEKHFFKPIIIDNECVIHSSFHLDVPQVKYDILIDPKMAFGTGHHATTSLIVSELLKMNLQNKALLDMGCGTAVLAILAAMRGAAPITAIDIDNWCTENAKENILLNRISGIEVLLGDAKLLKGKHFDIILANINRNILLAYMPVFSGCLSIGGELYMSGFYTDDVPIIEEEAHRCGFKMILFREKDNWAVVKMQKVLDVKVPA